MTNQLINQFHTIPEELRRDGQFCLWKYEHDETGRPTKVPYNPHNPKYHASVSDPNTFATFEEALRILGTNDTTFTGLGIRVTGDFVGVDIDHCVNTDGTFDERARTIIETLDSYTEISPSGHGVRIFLKAEYLAYDKATYYVKHGNLEVYIPGHTNRFLTVTGNVLLDKTFTGIEERTAELQLILDEYMKRTPKASETRHNAPKTPLNVSDGELLEKAMKNEITGNTFVRLWNGDFSGYNSQSEADMALCRLLAFWTAGRSDRIDTMFRQSGLYREKWDELRGAETYGQLTIAKAIQSTTNFYNPEYHKEKADGIDWDNRHDADDPGALDPITGRSENEPKKEPEPDITPGDALTEFFNEIQTERFKPVPTGINQLDEALNGGLERKQLVTVASAPGMGKTAISQYIFENMAKAGHPVIYVNLEMDRSQLLSRSISRIAYELNHPNGRPNEKTDLKTWDEVADITTTDIKRGYEWTETKRKRIEEAITYYRENIAPRFYYVTTNPENSGHITNQLSEILAKLENIADGMKASGKDAPLVCIDYLQFVNCDITADGQLIANTNEKNPDTAEAIKRTLQAFKNFAMKYNTVVWLIMANNRTSNKEGYASMDSGRDTSNIEYSGDVMLSLVYTAIEDKWQVPKSKDKEGNTKYGPCDLEFINDRIDFCRTIPGKDEPLIAKLQSLKVVKGRSLRVRGVARFVYNGAFSVYCEDYGIKNPYDERLTKAEAAEEQKQFDRKEEKLIRRHTLDELFARCNINGVASLSDIKTLSNGKIKTFGELEALIRQFPDEYKLIGKSVTTVS